MVLGLVTSSIGTKFNGHFGNLIADLAIDATTTIGVEIGQGMHEVDITKYVTVEKVPGGQLKDSKVLKGVVINKDVVAPGKMKRKIWSSCITFLDYPLEYKTGENQTNVELLKEEDVVVLLNMAEEYIENLCAQPLKFKPDLVITKRKLSDLACHYLSKTGVSLIQRVRKADNNRIAKACGAVIVRRLDELQESNVGTGAGLFEVRKIGDEFFAFIVDCKDPKACTVLLRGANKDLLNEEGSHLQDATKLKVSVVLKQKSSSIEGIEMCPYEAATIVFEAISRTLAQNCGVSVSRTVTTLQGKHVNGENAWIGIDTFSTLLCADGCSMIARRMGIYGYPIFASSVSHFLSSLATPAQATTIMDVIEGRLMDSIGDMSSSALTKLRGVLFYKILEDLHVPLCNKDEYSSAILPIDESNDLLPTAMANTIVSRVILRRRMIVSDYLDLSARSPHHFLILINGQSNEYLTSRGFSSTANHPSKVSDSAKIVCEELQKFATSRLFSQRSCGITDMVSIKMMDIAINFIDNMFKGIYNGKQYHVADIQVVLTRAWRTGVERTIVTGGSLEESKEALTIAETDARLFCTVGVHPTRCKEFDASGDPGKHFEALLSLAKEGIEKGNVVAIWIFNLVLSEPLKRLSICLCWVVIIYPSVRCFYDKSKDSKTKRILLRKYYHLLVVLMFLPALIIQQEFLNLALGATLAVFLVLEIIRIWRIWPLGQLVHQFMNAFTHHGDSHLLIVSHFSLLLGCALPIWFSSGFNDRPLAHFTGILSLGIGDTMALFLPSVIQKKYFEKQFELAYATKLPDFSLNLEDKVLSKGEGNVMTPITWDFSTIDIEPGPCLSN